MIDLNARRNAFRKGILQEAAARAAALLGTVQLAPRVVDIPVVLGTKGTPLTTGTHIFFRLGLNGQATVLTWSLAATLTGAAHAGAVTIDVQVGATLAAVASICGTNKPALAAQAERNDQLPTSWTTVTIADPSTILVTCTAADGVLEVVSLTLRVAVAPR